MASYVIVNMDVHDAEVFGRYRDQVAFYIERHGGKYIARGGDTRVVEGDWEPKRVVLIEFPTRAAAESFFADPEYLEHATLRHESAVSQVFIVDGL